MHMSENYNPRFELAIDELSFIKTISDENFFQMISNKEKLLKYQVVFELLYIKSFKKIVFNASNSLYPKYELCEIGKDSSNKDLEIIIAFKAGSAKKYLIFFY